MSLPIRWSWIKTWASSRDRRARARFSSPQPGSACPYRDLEFSQPLIERVRTEARKSYRTWDTHQVLDETVVAPG